MQNSKTMTKRVAAVFTLLLTLFLICILRLFTLATDEELVNAGEIQSSKRYALYRPRGKIYDCNMVPLTYKTEITKTVILPTEKGKAALAELTRGSEFKVNLRKLESGTPVIIDGGGLDIYEDTLRIKVPVAYVKDQSAVHLIGYQNGEGHGVSGIEKSMDSILYSDETADLVISTDAKGAALQGVSASVSGGGADCGIILTIDNRFQKITERAVSVLNAGAAVVVEAKTGKIRAMASFPVFDPNDVKSVLSAEDSPLINRALTPYSVGSVFKPCVAAAALENGISHTLENDCAGKMQIADRVFKCHKLSGHGVLDMCGAIGQSCNCYFYNLARLTGAENILRYARLCSFGQSRQLGCGIVQPGGTLPEENDIKNPGDLANLSIGQGGTLLTPLALTSLYEAIVCGGVYRTPTVLEATVKNGVKEENKAAAEIRVMTETTAQMLKSDLTEAFCSGTGKNADPGIAGVTAGGKTATAETGWIKNGRPVTHGWLCGFIEIGEKKFIITVFSEEAASGSGTCAPVFKEIASKIAQLDL